MEKLFAELEFLNELLTKELLALNESLEFSKGVIHSETMHKKRNIKRYRDLISHVELKIQIETSLSPMEHLESKVG